MKSKCLGLITVGAVFALVACSNQADNNAKVEAANPKDVATKTALVTISGGLVDKDNKLSSKIIVTNDEEKNVDNATTLEMDGNFLLATKAAAVESKMTTESKKATEKKFINIGCDLHDADIAKLVDGKEETKLVDDELEKEQVSLSSELILICKEVEMKLKTLDIMAMTLFMKDSELGVLGTLENKVNITVETLILRGKNILRLAGVEKNSPLLELSVKNALKTEDTELKVISRKLTKEESEKLSAKIDEDNKKAPAKAPAEPAATEETGGGTTVEPATATGGESTPAPSSATAPAVVPAGGTSPAPSTAKPADKFNIED